MAIDCISNLRIEVRRYVSDIWREISFSVGSDYLSRLCSRIAYPATVGCSHWRDDQQLTRKWVRGGNDLIFQAVNPIPAIRARVSPKHKTHLMKK